jgi:hypothetical protein
VYCWSKLCTYPRISCQTFVLTNTSMATVKKLRQISHSRYLDSLCSLSYDRFVASSHNEFSTEWDLLLNLSVIVSPLFLKIYSRCLRLLPRLLVSSILPSVLPSVTCFRSQLLCCMFYTDQQWKSNKYYILCVCVCVCVYSSYPSCNAHAQCCHLWPVRLYSIFPPYFKKAKFPNKVIECRMYVLIFPMTLKHFLL